MAKAPTNPTQTVELLKLITIIERHLVANEVSSARRVVREGGPMPHYADPHSLTVEVIRSRYRGGETAHELAADYNCTTEDIARALVEPHAQCSTASCARNNGHSGPCWPVVKSTA